MRLTPPRAVPIRDFDASLEEAFERLVLVPGHDDLDEESAIPAIAKPLNDVFTSLSAGLKRVGIKRSFKLDGLGYSAKSDYDYRNGTANLVRLLRVGSYRPAAAVKRAIDLGGESVQVSRHLIVDELKAKLVVVVTPVEFSSRTQKIEAEIIKVATDYPEAKCV